MPDSGDWAPLTGDRVCARLKGTLRALEATGSGAGRIVSHSSSSKSSLTGYSVVRLMPDHLTISPGPERRLRSTAGAPHDGGNRRG
jgi:hypothetical protein